MSRAAHVPADRVVEGPTPKHAQPREILRRTVGTELPPGVPIPSERELADRYGVSRPTVRLAIGKLVEEGLLSRVRGKVPGTCTAVPPPPSATALGLAEGEVAHRPHRLRRADGVPPAVERGRYHAGRLPGLLDLDLTGSLHTLLGEVHDIRPDHARRTVRAESADREAAKLPGIRPGGPLLVFRRMSSSHGEPVEDMTSWYRGDRYQMTVQLDQDTPAPGPDPHYGGTR